MRKRHTPRFTLARPIYPYGGWFILDSLTGLCFGVDGLLLAPRLGAGYISKDDALSMLHTLLTCHKRAPRKLVAGFAEAVAEWSGKKREAA